MPNYFLVSVSNHNNLVLCRKYCLAGFPNTANGFWTYLEVEEGDFVSFLYGAKIWDLYRVEEKVAVEGADESPEWQPVGRDRSYFPFRLKLKPVRYFEESLVREKFSLVAESLLPRTGYRKTHFQADQATLEAVSGVGKPHIGEVHAWEECGTRFTPKINFEKGITGPRKVYQFRELVLQALLKKHLRAATNLEAFLSAIGCTITDDQSMEVLGELALSEGQVDAIIKGTFKGGSSNIIAIEVKKDRATKKDAKQLNQYMKTIDEAIDAKCRGGVLVAKSFAPATEAYAREKDLHIFSYDFNSVDPNKDHNFEDLLAAFDLRPAMARA